MRLIPCFALLFLFGCSSVVPLRSMPTLSRIDLQTTDPSQIAIALNIDRALRPQAEFIQLRLSFQSQGSPVQVYDYKSIISRDQRLYNALRHAQHPNRQMYIFVLSEKDQKHMAQVRAWAKQARERGAFDKGQVDMTVQGFCAAGPVNPQTAGGEIFLKTSETGGFIRATKDLTLSKLVKLLSKGDESPLEFPACT